MQRKDYGRVARANASWAGAIVTTASLLNGAGRIPVKREVARWISPGNTEVRDRLARVISRVFLWALVCASAALCGATACNQLTQMTIPNVTIESAEMQASGSLALNGASFTVPAFCRVGAVARPVPDSEIHFEVWLPEATAWNGKFLGTGNGGYSSALSYPAMVGALKQGYATAGSDTGHSGSDLRFGLGHPEKVVDFAYRATHLMTTTAKLLVREAMGRFADESYFSSCSTGGHQAMSEVERFPDDYDGVIAGAPANNRIGQTFAFLYGWDGSARRTGKSSSQC